MEKWIHIFFSLYRDYSNSLTLTNASELFWSWISFNHIQVHEENEFCYCLFTPFTKRELGIFTGSRAVDGKEMYKKAWCTCKVVVLPCQATAYLTFCRRRILNFLLFTIHCDPWKTEYSGQIQLLLLIASQTFFRLIGSSFVSGKLGK